MTVFFNMLIYDRPSSLFLQCRVCWLFCSPYLLLYTASKVTKVQAQILSGSHREISTDIVYARLICHVYILYLHFFPIRTFSYYAFLFSLRALPSQLQFRPANQIIRGIHNIRSELHEAQWGHGVREVQPF